MTGAQQLPAPAAAAAGLHGAGATQRHAAAPGRGWLQVVGPLPAVQLHCVTHSKGSSYGLLLLLLLLLMLLLTSGCPNLAFRRTSAVKCVMPCDTSSLQQYSTLGRAPVGISTAAALAVPWPMDNVSHSTMLTGLSRTVLHHGPSVLLAPHPRHLIMIRGDS
jgi:hypothetical protein